MGCEAALLSSCHISAGPSKKGRSDGVYWETLKNFSRPRGRYRYRRRGLCTAIGLSQLNR